MTDDQEFEIVLVTPATMYVNRTQNLNVKVTAATYEEAREALEHTLGALASKHIETKRALDRAQVAFDHMPKRYYPVCLRCSGAMVCNGEGIWRCPVCVPRVDHVAETVAGTVAMLCQACKGSMQVNTDKIWVCPTCTPDPCNTPP